MDGDGRNIGEGEGKADFDGGGRRVKGRRRDLVAIDAIVVVLDDVVRLCSGDGT